MRRLAVPLVLLLLLLPSLGADSFWGPGYLLLRVSTTGDAAIHFQFNLTGVGMARVQGISNGQLQTGGHLYPETSDVDVGAEAAGTTVRLTPREARSTEWISGAYLVGAGEHLALLSLHGEVGTWSYRLGPGAENVTSIVEERGPSNSFALAQTYAEAFVVGAGARPTPGTTLEFDIDKGLVGWFIPPVTGLHAHAGLVTLEGPDGIHVCPCVYFEPRGPGHYRLEWTGATVSAVHGVLAGWVDVDLST